MADIQNTFSMSFSRGRMLAECERKYFWRAYGSWGGWDWKLSDDDPSRLSYCLSKGSSLAALVGSFTHDVAQSAILGAHQNMPPLTAESEASLALSKFDQHLRQAWGQAWKRDPKHKPLVIEILYMTDRERLREQVEAAKDKLTHCIHSLFASRHLKRITTGLRDGGTLKLVATEDLEQHHIEVEDHPVTVWVVPDAIVRSENGNYMISEWKTGRVRPDDPRQVGLYADWLVTKEPAELDKIASTTVYLSHQKEVVQRATTESVEEAHDSIRKSVHHAILLIDGGDMIINRALPIEAFEQQTEGSRSCRFCDYRSMCGR